METYTVRSVSAVTGLTEKAVRRRLEKGQLRAVRGRDGRVRLAHGELVRAGLLPLDGGVGGNAPPSAPETGVEAVRELVAMIERQATELGRLRAIAVRSEQDQAEVVRLQGEVFRLRAEVETLRQVREGRTWRMWGRRPRGVVGGEV